ncbi:Uncharacterised protein [Mycobacterium tuberculosis]|nr:Uncharacterised protein [Mycobacterium tuberculosis]COW51160.1 Uncharacterised protein [Mycobacterium tuberculosis]
MATSSVIITHQRVQSTAVMNSGTSNADASTGNARLPRSSAKKVLTGTAET